MTSHCKPDISGMPQAAVLAGFPKQDPAGGAECPLVSLLLVSNSTCGYYCVQPACPELSSSSVPSVPSAGQLPLPLGGSGRASAPQKRATEGLETAQSGLLPLSCRSLGLGREAVHQDMAIQEHQKPVVKHDLFF